MNSRLRSAVAPLSLGLALFLAGCGGGDATVPAADDQSLIAPPSLSPTTRIAAATLAGDLAYLDMRADDALELTLNGRPAPIVDCFGQSGGPNGGELVFQRCPTPKGTVFGNVKWTATTAGWNVQREVTLSQIDRAQSLRLTGTSTWTNTNFLSGRTTFQRTSSNKLFAPDGQIQLDSQLTWSRVNGRLFTKYPAGTATIKRFDLRGRRTQDATVTFDGTQRARIVADGSTYTYDIGSVGGALIPIDNGPEVERL